jgi:hypothetical protein
MGTPPSEVWAIWTIPGPEGPGRLVGCVGFRVLERLVVPADAPRRGTGAGRLAFPAALLALDRRRSGPSRTALVARRRRRLSRRGQPRAVRAPPSARLDAGIPRVRRNGRDPCLSWGSSLRPFVDVPAVRPLHGIRRSRSGRRSHPSTSRSVRVVSHHLDGFLRTAVAGLLHPAADLGVRRVSRLAPPEPEAEAPSSGDPDVPRDGVHTLRRVPLVRSRTASPRPLPSCRCRRSSR